MAYNPFTKPIGKTLDTTDLDQLIIQQIREGFYVEYKSTFVDSKKIARSIASFANTNGGWYFVGIETDAYNVASKICGFDIIKFSDPIAKVMDVARQGLSHMPVLTPQVIILDTGLAVLAVYIEEGEEPPYITNAGEIYRRAGDASDPVGEKDRYSLDRLVDRGRKERERFDKFCTDDRDFAEDEHAGWASIYLQPNPRVRKSLLDFTDKKLLSTMLTQANDVHTLMTFDKGEDKTQLPVTASMEITAIHVAGESVLLRYSEPRDALIHSRTLQLFPSGAAKIHIPLVPMYLHGDNLGDQFSDPHTARQLDKLIQSHRYNRAKYINFGFACAAIMVMSAIYRSWLTANTDSSKIWFRIQVRDVWRSIPVVDSRKWAAITRLNGPPIAHFNSLYFPKLDTPPISVDLDDGFAIGIFPFVGMCVGIAPLHLSTMTYDIWANHANLHQPR